MRRFDELRNTQQQANSAIQKLSVEVYEMAGGGVFSVNS